MAAPDLDICNLALAQIPQAKITSLNENSLAAQWTLPAYPQALGEMLEKHKWRFARRWATLAAVENDQAQQWRHAYALPSDMVGEPVSLMLDPAKVAGYCGPAAGDDVAYDISGDTLYCYLPSARLRYTSGEIEPAKFPATFRYALALEIASRVVMPILKSSSRQGDLIKAASVAWQRALAEDINRAPEKMMDFVPHDVAARFDCSDLPWSR